MSSIQEQINVLYVREADLMAKSPEYNAVINEGGDGFKCPSVFRYSYRSLCHGLVHLSGQVAVDT
jgi:hypothetical protein